MEEEGVEVFGKIRQVRGGGGKSNDVAHGSASFRHPPPAGERRRSIGPCQRGSASPGNPTIIGGRIDGSIPAICVADGGRSATTEKDLTGRYHTQIDFLTAQYRGGAPLCSVADGDPSRELSHLQGVRVQWN